MKKDIDRSRLTTSDAEEIRSRMSAVKGIAGLSEVDIAIEVNSFSLITTTFWIYLWKGLSADCWDSNS